MIHSERGGILSFIIVGIVLIGLLAGGITLIKNRADKLANTPSPSQTAEVTKQTKKEAEQDKATENTPPAATSDSQTTQQPATTTPTVPEPTSSSSDSNGEIASTGPTETLTTTLVLGFLAFFATRYFQTRSLMTQQ